MGSAEMSRTRIAEPNDFEHICAFYLQQNYAQPISTRDTLVVAEGDKGIIGALRLCEEEGLLVLRGMRVDENYRRQGVGAGLLHQAVDVIQERECYCIPHHHLRSFYGRVGFVEIDPKAAPFFLQERINRYTTLGLDVILMVRSKRLCNSPKSNFESAVH